MKIASVKMYSTRELISRLRRVCMLHDRQVFPYDRAEIAITDVHPTSLAPAQLYVLRSEFEKVRALRWAMQQQYSIDILRLSDTKIRDGVAVSPDFDNAESLGFIEIWLDNGDEPITVLPPVVETWTESDKSSVNIINDGMHRCYLARTSWVIPAVIKISKVPTNLPYYAYPLPGGWSDVSMIDELREGYLKKFHRFQAGTYHKYYRDFNSSFKNVGGPRGTKAG